MGLRFGGWNKQICELMRFSLQVILFIHLSFLPRWKAIPAGDASKVNAPLE
jgi:hypothetical protein